MQAQQQMHMKNYGDRLTQDEQDRLLFDKDPNQDEESDPLKRPMKPKKFNGLLEWVLQQEGHEFLVDIDRSFIKNKENLIGLKEKLKEELNMKEEQLDDR